MAGGTLARIFLAASGPDLFRLGRALRREDPARAEAVLAAIESPAQAIGRLDDEVLRWVVSRLTGRDVRALRGVAPAAWPRIAALLPPRMRDQVQEEMGSEAPDRAAARILQAISDARASGFTIGPDYRAALVPRPCPRAEPPAEAGSVVLRLDASFALVEEPVVAAVHAPGHAGRPLALRWGANGDPTAVWPDADGWAYEVLSPPSGAPGLRELQVGDAGEQALARASLAIAAERIEAAPRVVNVLWPSGPAACEVLVAHEGPAAPACRLEVYCAAAGCAQQIDEVEVSLANRSGRATLDLGEHAGPFFIECRLPGLASVTDRLPAPQAIEFPERNAPRRHAPGRLAMAAEPAALAQWLQAGPPGDSRAVAELIAGKRLSFRTGSEARVALVRDPGRVARTHGFVWLAPDLVGRFAAGHQPPRAPDPLRIDLPAYLGPEDRIVGCVRVSGTGPGTLTLRNGGLETIRTAGAAVAEAEAWLGSPPIQACWTPDGGDPPVARSWRPRRRVWGCELLRVALAGDLLSSGTVVHDPSRLARRIRRGVARYPFGCAEQTLSKLRTLCQLAAVPGHPALRLAEILQSAEAGVRHLESLWSQEGDFRLWPGSALRYDQIGTARHVLGVAMRAGVPGADQLLERIGRPPSGEPASLAQAIDALQDLSASSGRRAGALEYLLGRAESVNGRSLGWPSENGWLRSDSVALVVMGELLRRPGGEIEVRLRRNSQPPGPGLLALFLRWLLGKSPPAAPCERIRIHDPARVIAARLRFPLYRDGFVSTFVADQMLELLSIRGLAEWPVRLEREGRALEIARTRALDGECMLQSPLAMVSRPWAPLSPGHRGPLEVALEPPRPRLGCRCRLVVRVRRELVHTGCLQVWLPGVLEPCDPEAATSDRQTLSIALQGAACRSIALRASRRGRGQLTAYVADLYGGQSEEAVVRMVEVRSG